MLSGNLDVSTPPERVEHELMPHLSQGQHLVFSDYGHVGDLRRMQNGAAMAAAIQFLAGHPPASHTNAHHPMDLTTRLTLGGVAKVLLFGGLLLLTAGAVAMTTWLVRS